MYIITSKTRRRSPNGRTVAMEHPERGDTRICDERYAEARLRRGNGWTEPKAIPGVTDKPGFTPDP